MAQQYTKKTIVPAKYQQFAKVFSKEELKQYPLKWAWDHAIEFKKDTPDAIDCNVYPLNCTEDKAVQKFLTKEVEKGYIWPFKSPYTSPFLFTKKKDSKLQPVQDYCKINAITVCNQYPLPLITDLIHDLSNAHLYTNSMCAGDITMSATARETGTQQPSKHNTASMNQLLCTLALLTC